MDLKDISPDQIIYWQWGPVHLNATIIFTWGIMLLMVIGAWLITRRLSTDIHLSRWQNLFEIIVKGMKNEIRDVSNQAPAQYLPLVGTLFLFIAVSNLLSIVPFYVSPTASLSTTAGLAICVFVAVPVLCSAVSIFFNDSFKSTEYIFQIIRMNHFFDNRNIRQFVG